jgi:hypothetical protein
MAEHTREELQKLFERMEAVVTSDLFAKGGEMNTAQSLGISLLGQAIIKLDATSSKLATANIWVGVVIALVGVIQLVMMFKHP